MIAILFKSCLISLLVSPGLLALPVFQPEKPIRTCDGEEFPDLNKPYEHVGGISLGHFHPRETASCSRLSNPNHPIAGGSGIRISPQEATPGGDNPFWSRKRPAHDQPATRKSKCLKYTQDGAPESTRAQQFGTQEGEPKASKNSDVDLVTTQCVTDVSQAGILGSPEKGNHQERPPHLDVYNWNLVEIQGSRENDKHREEISRKLNFLFEELKFHRSDGFYWIPATDKELRKVIKRFNRSKFRFHVECGSNSNSRRQKLQSIIQHLSDEKLALDEYPTFSTDIMFHCNSKPTDPQRPSQTHILLRESTQDTYYYFASFYYLVRTLSSPLLRPFFTNQTGLPFKLPLQRYFGSSPEGTWIRPISTISIQAFFDLIKNVQTGLDDISLDRLPFESRIKDPIVDVIIHDLAEQQCDQSGKISTPDYINL
ncbi:hypothetical protein H4Q26_000303 [Puccinia striiformis f. sp. tritici PST-130]|nr:hypothetical protein H4Q26_000303 [Puccinia striiformis f. sp. tritici PST-130]